MRPPDLRPGGRPGVSSLPARRPRLLLIVALAFSLLAVLPARHLRIGAQLTDILPFGTPAARDYREFLQTFGGAERIFIAVAGEGASSREIADAARRLAAKLTESPLVASARSGIEPGDEEFFLEQILPRAPLLLDDADLLPRLRPRALHDQVTFLRERLLGPAGQMWVPIATADPLGLAGPLAAARAGGLSLPLDEDTGAFLSPARDTGLVIVHPAASELDPESGRALARLLVATSAEVNAEISHPLQFLAVGGPLYAAEDERILRSDLVRTGSGSVIVITLLLLVVFGDLLIPLASLLAVAAGLLWTAGALALGVGQLSAVGVGFAVILVGLGVDYGIHGGSHFRDRLAAGDDRGDAVTDAIRTTGPGILASALTTAAAFACLAFARFRPLQETGLAVAVGMMAILAGAFTAGAPLLRLVPGRASRWPAGGRALAAAVRHIGEWASRRPRTTLAGVGMLAAVSLGGLAGLRLDADPRRLRPEDHPAAEAQARLSSAFALEFDTSTVVVHGGSLSDALDAADRVAGILRTELGPAATVRSPSDWIVDGQRLRDRGERLRRANLAGSIDDLRREIDAAGLRTEPFEPALAALRALADPDPPGPPPISTWPEWLTDSIRQDAGGAAVAVQIRRADGADPLPPELLARLRQVAPGAAYASAPRVGAELREIAMEDLGRLGEIAGIAVLAVILLSFRGSPFATATAILPVILGGIGTFGLWGFLGRPIDLFCLAVLPVMIGIGVDDGLHVVHRARRDRSGLGTAVSGAGRAIALTSLTTAAGFASLGLSRVPALRNGGLMIATGVLACFFATVVVLPAISGLRRRGGAA